MFTFGRRCAAVIVTLAIGVSACRGDPPEKEIQQAQGAIDAARAAGAADYAQEEYGAAEQALKNARDAVGQRDYRLALNNALDSREHAQNAAKQTADNKAAARSDADRALIEATTALTEARARLKSADAAQRPARAHVLRRTIADTDSAVQKARAAYAAGEYRSLSGEVRQATAHLRRATRDVEGASLPFGRRRR
jgi:hypothetical protein